MKKFLLLSAIVMSMYGTANAVPVVLDPGTITLKDGAPAGPYGFTLGTGNYASGSYTELSGPNNTTMTTNNIGEKSEFRLINTNGFTVGGGEKSLFGLRDDGTVSDNGLDNINWTIGSSGVVVATDGDLTPGATNSPGGQVTGLTSNALFFEDVFGFAGVDQIVATVDYSTNKLMVDTASIEMQWGNTFFPLGKADAGNECNTDGQGCGIRFEGDIVPLGGGAFDFTLFGEHRMTLWEASEGGTIVPTGFEGMALQWAWSGTYIPSAIPVPAAFWLFGSGLIGLIGFARRKK